MPTLTDLHAAFDAEAEHAPTPPEMLALLADRGPERRWRLPLLAAAAVVVVAAGVAVPATLLSGGHRTPGANSAPAVRTTAPTTPASGSTHVRSRPPGPSATPFVFDFQFRNTAAISFEYDGILPHRQVADVLFGSARKGDATAIVYDTGAFDAALATGGTRVTVNGRTGYLARFADPYDPLDPSTHLSVAWPYAENSWAVVWANDSAERSPAKLLAAARLLRPGHAARIRIPFKVGYLPPGVVRESVGAFAAGGTVGFTDGGAPDPQMSPFPGLGTGFEVDVRSIDQCGPPCTVNSKGHVHVDRQGGYDLDAGKPVSVHGHRAFYKSGQLIVIAPNWFYTVSFSGGGRNRFTEAELLAVARSVVVARQIGDEQTWYDAHTAIP